MPEKIRCAHILLKNRTEAEAVMLRLKAGEDFAKVAQEKSLCPSKRRGGDLGFFGRGQMVREFEQAAFALQKGQMSDIVKTEFGCHIIKRLD